MKGHFTFKITITNLKVNDPEGRPLVNLDQGELEIVHELDIEPENYGKFLETIPGIFMQMMEHMRIPPVRPDHEQRNSDGF